MARTGRPRLQIDPDQFEKLCAIRATEEEIASWFDCSVDTLSRWCKRHYKMTFADVFKQKGSKGIVSLRRKQFETAMGGNVTMQIWLGKQILGQSEKVTSVNKTDLEARVATIDKEELRKANEELESEC